jgi:hypothetical protein
MLIFFSSSSSIKIADLGWVADYCRICLGVGPSRITRVFFDDSNYFVSIGSGTTLFASGTCAHCRVEAPCQLESYRCFLSWRQVTACSPEEFLQQTNPQLDALRGQLVNLSRDCEAASADADCRQRLAMLRLRELGLQTPEVFRFQDELLGWHRLAAADCLRLSHDVNAYADQVRESQRLDLLMRSAVRRCPQAAGCAPATLFSIVAGIFFLWLGAHSDNLSFRWALGVLWVALLPTSQFLLSRWAYRRWFTKHVLEPAEIGEIEPSVILDTLEELKRTKHRNPHVRDMANRLGMFKRIAQERKAAVASE